VLLVATTGGVGVASVARAQVPEPVTIDVQATIPGPPLEPVWAYYGYDEANYTTTAEGGELIAALAAAHATPVHLRTHFLFNTGDGTPKLKWGSTNIYTEDAVGNAVFDFTLIDQIMDATVDRGAFPLFELGFMPRAISSHPEPYENSNTYRVDGGCFYPPLDYGKWAALVGTWAAHVKERYPGAESEWEWELWNEPDIPYWQGTREEFFQLYDHTETALHAVLPSASLGGPAVANPGEFLSEFLEHCANGRNAATGQVGTRLDMVSFHAKGGVFLIDGHPQMDLGNQLRLHRAGFEAVAASAFKAAPIVISEADPDGCAACPEANARQNAYRNSPAYGAYEVAMMKRTLDLATELDVNLRGVLTWAFTFPGSDYFAGYRALATNGIHLPVMNAFKFLGKLRGSRLPVTSTGARPMSEILEASIRQNPDVDALSALDGNRIQILVWHYHDDLVEAPAVPVTVDVAMPSKFGARALVTHSRVDTIHGNAYTVWDTQGRPLSPTDAQLAELRAAADAVAFEPAKQVEVTNGTLTVSFELPRYGVSLLTIEGAVDGSGAPVDSTQGSRGCSCALLPIADAAHTNLLAFALVALVLRRLRLQ
jgi:xylan 1,4-beta-xylosidase